MRGTCDGISSLGGRERGFTLIEILIVMGLVGVLVALTAPNLTVIIPQIKVDKAASKLAADLRLAQQKAVEEMALVRFRIEPSQNRYYAMVRERGAAGLWYQDGYNDYVEDPLKGGAYLLVDFDVSTNRFHGVEITSISPASALGETWGFYISELGELRWPFSDITVTLTDPRSGYSRQVQITHPLGKVTVLP